MRDQRLETDIVVQKGIYSKFFKRPIDFLLALLSVIVFSPLFVVISFLVLNKLGKPVIFRQERPGLNEKTFILYKFRTMTDSRDEKGELLPDSLRLTPFGKWLRRTSVDELPELFNILKGDMSVVGPRPLLKAYLPYYTRKERARHLVRPGLSGLAQISGRNGIAWADRLEKDVEYTQRISFSLDSRIVLETIRMVLKSKGVSEDTQRTEGNFAVIRKRLAESVHGE
jgi:lipopolysaccharide/colanic/teichoic acid biosynthesis glycosyltransferase